MPTWLQAMPHPTAAVQARGRPHQAVPGGLWSSANAGYASTASVQLVVPLVPPAIAAITATFIVLTILTTASHHHTLPTTIALYLCTYSNVF